MDGYGWWQECNCRKGYPIPHHQKLLLHPVSIVCAMVIAPLPETFLVYCRVCAMDLKSYRSVSLITFFQFPLGLELIIYDNTFHLHVYSQNRESQCANFHRRGHATMTTESKPSTGIYSKSGGVLCFHFVFYKWTKYNFMKECTRNKLTSKWPHMEVEGVVIND